MSAAVLDKDMRDSIICKYLLEWVDSFSSTPLLIGFAQAIAHAAFQGCSTLVAPEVQTTPHIYIAVGPKE
jgi:hypothetical protein